MMSSSSCGLCGKTSMDELELEASPVRDHGALNGELVPRLQRLMRSRQAGFDRSGGVHAAAAFTLEGELLAVREDIGRHNAVDKVIGVLLREETLDRAAAMTVSGRVSFEIVSKAARANIQHLIAVSAPSSMAVEMCAAHGMTLIGFCREGRFTTYAHPEAISWETSDVRVADAALEARDEQLELAADGEPREAVDEDAGADEGRVQDDERELLRRAEHHLPRLRDRARRHHPVELHQRARLQQVAEG